MSDPASALKDTFKQVVQIGAVVKDLDRSNGEKDIDSFGFTDLRMGH